MRPFGDAKDNVKLNCGPAVVTSMGTAPLPSTRVSAHLESTGKLHGPIDLFDNTLTNGSSSL